MTQNIIKCNKCGNEIELTQALTNDIEEKIKSTLSKKFQQEMREFQSAKEEEMKERTKKFHEKLRQEMAESVRKEYETKIDLVKREAEMQAKLNLSYKEELDKYQNEVLENRQKINKYEQDKRKLEIEYQNKILHIQSEIEKKVHQEFEHDSNLKLLEKDRQLLEMQKQIQSLQQKITQGSQQSQGEVLEEEIERILKEKFNFDEIAEVPKGVRGADIIQTVRTKSGSPCGTIIWEVKNTRVWSNEWIRKLKQDKLSLKAHFAIIVTRTLPEGFRNFTIINGIYVCSLDVYLTVAISLRNQLLELYSLSQSHEGIKTKAEEVYSYLSSNEFKERIESWVEYFISRKNDIEKEKRYFMSKWQKEEKQIQGVVNSTIGIYGDIKGIIGNSLPRIGNLEFED